MHALPSHPSSPILLALAAVLAVLVLLVTAGFDPSAVDLSFGGGPPPAEPVTEPPAASPTWVHDPLASPIATLEGH